MMPALPLSVVIHTRNEAAQIVACLEGLKGWAAEVIVADMQSTDRTVELARPLADVVLNLPLMAEFDAARNDSAALATQPWILMLDADERLTSTVRDTIAHLIHRAPEEVGAYQLPFKVISFGGWIQHAGNWWPNYKSPPLLRQGRFRFSGKVHEPAIVDGLVVRVAPRNEDDAIVHYSHRDLAHYFDKLNRYTDLEALKREAPGSWEDAARGMGEVFAWYYDATQGKLDGVPGFFLAFGSAVYEALTQLKLMERSGEKRIPPDAAAFLQVALEAAQGTRVHGRTRDIAAEVGGIAALVPGIAITDSPGKALLSHCGHTFGLTWPGATIQPDLTLALVTHANALSIMGGGEVQLFETARALEAANVRALVGVGSVPDGGDLIHLFSLHHAEIDQDLAGRPYVLTPIYWDRAELAWLAPRILAIGGRAETLPELEAAFTSLHKQAESLRMAGAFVTRLPEHLRRLAIGAAAILPNAQCEADMLCASIGESLPSVTVVPNAAPSGDGLAAPSKREFAEPFVLCAGRLEVNKNQLALIAACRMIDVPLVLVGSELDPHYAAICRRVAGPQTTFLGQRSREQVRSLMGQAAVHALPSFAETPGLANLEAARAGCSLVCSNRGAEREYFGDEARYCEPLDLTSIASGIEAVIRSGKREPVRQPATWELVGRMTATTYREVLRTLECNV